MRMQRTQSNIKNRKIDWALVAFWGRAYAISWGVFAIIVSITNQSGLEGVQTLILVGETGHCGNAIVSVWHWWIMSLLRYIANFSFSFAGVIACIVVWHNSKKRMPQTTLEHSKIKLED